MTTLKKRIIIFCAFFTALPAVASDSRFTNYHMNYQSRSKSAPSPKRNVLPQSKFYAQDTGTSILSNTSQVRQPLTRQELLKQGNNFLQASKAAIDPKTIQHIQGTTPLRPSHQPAQPTQPLQQLNREERNALGTQYQKKATPHNPNKRDKSLAASSSPKAVPTSAFGASAKPAQPRAKRPTDYSTKNVGHVPKIHFKDQVPKLPFYRVKARQGPFAPRNRKPNDNENDSDNDTETARSQLSSNSSNNSGDSDHNNKPGPAVYNAHSHTPNKPNSKISNQAKRRLRECRLSDNDSDTEVPNQTIHKQTPRIQGETTKQAARRRLMDYTIPEDHEESPTRVRNDTSEDSCYDAEIGTSSSSCPNSSSAHTSDNDSDDESSQSNLSSSSSSKKSDHIDNALVPGLIPSESNQQSIQSNTIFHLRQAKPKNFLPQPFADFSEQDNVGAPKDSKKTAETRVENRINDVNPALKDNKHEEDSNSITSATTYATMAAAAGATYYKRATPQEKRTNNHKTSNKAKETNYSLRKPLTLENDFSALAVTDEHNFVANKKPVPVVPSTTLQSFLQSFLVDTYKNNSSSAKRVCARQPACQGLISATSSNIDPQDVHILPAPSSPECPQIEAPWATSNVEFEPYNQLPSGQEVDTAIARINSIVPVKNDASVNTNYSNRMLSLTNKALKFLSSQKTAFETGLVNTPSDTQIPPGSVEILPPLVSCKAPALEASAPTFNAEFDPYKQLPANQNKDVAIAKINSIVPVNTPSDIQLLAEFVEILPPLVSRKALALEASAPTFNAEFEPYNQLPSEQEVDTAIARINSIVPIKNDAITNTGNPNLILSPINKALKFLSSQKTAFETGLVNTPSDMQFPRDSIEILPPLVSYETPALEPSGGTFNVEFEPYKQLPAAKAATPLLAPNTAVPCLLRAYFKKTSAGIACGIAGSVAAYFYKKYYDQETNQESQETSHQNDQKAIPKDMLQDATTRRITPAPANTQDSTSSGALDKHAKQDSAIKHDEKQNKEINNQEIETTKNSVEQKENDIAPLANQISIKATPNNNSYSFVAPIVIFTGIVIGAVYAYKKWKAYKAAQEKKAQEVARANLNL